MMPKLLTRRFWAVFLALVAIYAAAGISSAIQGRIDEWVYRIGLTGTTLVAVSFILAWTLYGLFAKQSARWWKTDLSAWLVIVILGFLPSFGGLAYAFDFTGGILHPGWDAWVTLSGPILEMIALSWVACLWMRTIETKRQREIARSREAGKA